MQVIGTVFERGKAYGDFGRMIEQPEYADSLFVFNDNEEQFLSFRAGKAGGCDAGGGNAAIRPYRCEDPPRAAGIPTGRLAGSGYAALTPEVRRVIDDAVAYIRTLVGTGRYRRIFYSAADATGALGTGIFTVGDEVKRYIVEELRKLERPEEA